MSFPPPTFPVYLITPDGPWADVVSVVEAVARHAPSKLGVQLRSKTASDEALAPVARALRKVTSDYGCPFFINGRVELAIRVRADGVHLPEAAPDAPVVRRAFKRPVSIARSCHDLTGLDRAQVERADLLVLGPIGAVAGKNDPMGVSGFEKLMQQRAPSTARPAVFALGGIGPLDVPALMKAGAAGVAVMRHVFAAACPEDAIDALLDAFST